MVKKMIKRKITCRDCQVEFEKMVPIDIMNVRGKFCCSACEKEAKEKGVCIICKKPGRFHLH